VKDVVTSGGVEALVLIAELVDVGPSTEASAVTVGAGPLEDLVHGHGLDLGDGIERLGRRRPRFAAARRSIWLEHGAR